MVCGLWFLGLLVYGIAGTSYKPSNPQTSDERGKVQNYGIYLTLYKFILVHLLAQDIQKHFTAP